MIVGIHQPNLFPWLGYFNKIRCSSVFVFLDNVQIQKTGSAYGNRVTVLSQGKPLQITASIRRHEGFSTFREAMFADRRWISTAIKTLQVNYAKAPFFKEHRDFVFELMSCPSNGLAEYNINFIKAICVALNISTPLVVESEVSINASWESSTDRLIGLVRLVGGTEYISGAGGASYQDEEMFRDAGIGLRFVDNTLRDYPQRGADSHVRGLSVLDAIFNVGIPGVADLLGE